ncbi:hypothetical protein, partial [Candidatus Bathycorpusculum sp.]|uniref:hypothetical protein n=1 Tax=Candidatus Bathycorpusculum sp. TaxID=2994959 RepID=UPI00282233C3|nr:hypothetical protein [Candidatus Termitimicrobium sp.]
LTMFLVGWVRYFWKGVLQSLGGEVVCRKITRVGNYFGTRHSNFMYFLFPKSSVSPLTFRLHGLCFVAFALLPLLCCLCFVAFALPPLSIHKDWHNFRLHKKILAYRFMDASDCKERICSS